MIGTARQGFIDQLEGKPLWRHTGHPPCLAGFPALKHEINPRPMVRQSTIQPLTDRATMPDRTQHEGGFEGCAPIQPSRRPESSWWRRWIAGALERPEQTRLSGQGDHEDCRGHSMAHASEPGSSPENGLAAAPKLEVVYDAEAREMVLEIGPLDMPANASHHDVVQPEAQVGTLPVAGWIHGFRVELVDAEGREVPRPVLHHVNVISPDERELFSQIMLRIAAAGQETGAVELPRLLGYPVREGHRLLVTAMFHNPTPQAYRGVKLRVRMDFTPVGTWLRPIPVYPLYMDVMPPAGIHAYDLPPGRSEKSWEGSPAIPGRLLGVGGHLHKYGVALRLEDVTTGELLWEATPILDEEGEVSGCRSPGSSGRSAPLTRSRLPAHGGLRQPDWRDDPGRGDGHARRSLSPPAAPRVRCGPQHPSTGRRPGDNVVRVRPRRPWQPRAWGGEHGVPDTAAAGTGCTVPH